MNPPPERSWRRRGIRARLLVTMIGLIIGLITTLTWVLVSSGTSLIQRELGRRTSLMKAVLIERGKTLADNLARQAGNDIAAFNFSNLAELAANAVRENEELRYTILMDSARKAYIHTLHRELETEILQGEADRFAASQTQPAVNEFTRDGQPMVEFIVPIRMGMEPWGTLRLGFSLDKVNEEIRLTRQEIIRQNRRMVLSAALTSFIFIVLGIVVVTWVSTRLSQPIVQLTGYARELSRGNFTASSGIRVDAAEEVSLLARTLAAMAENLRHSYRELEEANRTLEQKVEERTREAEEARRAAERANETKSQFLASMSHELRTPLTSMLALTEVLRDGLASPLNPAQSRHVQLIDESSRHLLDLINDVLEVAQLEARLVRVQPVPCHVRDMVEAAVRLLRGQAQAKRIFLHVHPGPDQLHVLADPLRLKQMLTNLLSNAIKFTLPGGQVGVRVTVDDAAVHFCVEDTGIGIEPEKMALLFQPFVQIESGLARRYGGSGLGLVIVKRFAELLAGSVAVESTPGRGSRFTVSLPVHRSAHLEPTPDPTQPTAAPPPQPAEAPVPAVRVLVVEDNELNRSVLADYLSARGFEVATAENGLDALNQIAAVQPQVVVMDIQMPEIDGLEVSRRIRQMSDPKISQVSILALTALAMPGDRERCLAAGVTDYLSKPFTLKDLDRCLREMAATSTSLGR